MKLPAFYVLDAISKNVYDPYSAKFSIFVVPLFLEAYSQVDPQTRSKMEEMLVTWRTGAPSGKELFGVAAQVSLERQIWGNDPSVLAESVRDVHPAPQPRRKLKLVSPRQSSRRTAHAPITKSQVLAELDVTLALKEQAILANPYDSLATNQANVLRQVCPCMMSKYVLLIRLLSSDAWLNTVYHKKNYNKFFLSCGRWVMKRLQLLYLHLPSLLRRRRHLFPLQMHHRLSLHLRKRRLPLFLLVCTLEMCL